jgi:hypothetical protein
MNFLNTRSAPAEDYRTTTLQASSVHVVFTFIDIAKEWYIALHLGEV